jgi:hypothetical protein
MGRDCGEVSISLFLRMEKVDEEDRVSLACGGPPG